MFGVPAGAHQAIVHKALKALLIHSQGPTSGKSGVSKDRASFFLFCRQEGPLATPEWSL